jgi:hypothetical protein
MKHILSTLIAAALLAAPASFATTRYYSDCQAGADAACVPGDDSLDGLTPENAKRTLTSGALHIKALGAGEHTIRFARGGSFTYAGSMQLGNGKNADQGLVVDSYVPSWGSGTALPLLTFTPGTVATNNFNTAGFILTSTPGPYTFRNIEMVGPYNTCPQSTTAELPLRGCGNGFSVLGPTTGVLIERRRS